LRAGGEGAASESPVGRGGEKSRVVLDIFFAEREKDSSFSEEKEAKRLLFLGWYIV
jgi:hypothetical protein